MRVDGEDAEHVRRLAALGAGLPPILVHRSSMRVVDGMHRLGAARLRGATTIDARFFEGTEQEAFLLAVRANADDGLPLSGRDRTAAAERVMAMHADWSDRAIAAASGLGATTVAGLRRRVQPGAAGTRRVGRDGRVRPLDGAAGRRRVSELLREHPGLPLRRIAEMADVSPSTAFDVRNRIRRGEDPVPHHPGAARPGASGGGAGADTAGHSVAHHAGAVGPEASAGGAAADIAALPAVQDSVPQRAGPARPGASAGDVAALVAALAADPSLGHDERGLALLRNVLTHAVRAGEWGRVAGDVPPQCTGLLADVARQCAAEWSRLGDTLDRHAGRHG